MDKDSDKDKDEDRNTDTDMDANTDLKLEYLYKIYIRRSSLYIAPYELPLTHHSANSKGVKNF